MCMQQDVIANFPMLVRSLLHGSSVTADELRTVLKIAFLTVEIDLDEDSEEMAELQAISRMLWDVVGHEPEPLPLVSPLPLPVDIEERSARIRELATHLQSSQSRELAYAFAYLFSVLDLQYAPIEDEFLDELQAELDIDDGRASDLSRTAASFITPGVADAIHASPR